jgi:pyoverdine/dityrosine biosynthesis protein Dit1
MFIECLYSMEQHQAEVQHRAAGVIGQNKKNSMLLTTAVPCCTIGSVVAHIHLQSGPDFGQYRAQK